MVITPVSEDQLMEGTERCAMCKGYGRMIHAPLSALPITAENVARYLANCPICYGYGFVISDKHREGAEATK